VVEVLDVPYHSRKTAGACVDQNECDLQPKNLDDAIEAWVYLRVHSESFPNDFSRGRSRLLRPRFIVKRYFWLVISVRS
jgi:hypothetical protein